jgi:hypothetical protein
VHFGWLSDDDEGRPQPWISLCIHFRMIDHFERCLTHGFGVSVRPESS